MEKTSKKTNFKKLTLKRGISLITLVITIVVIIILAMAVILSLNNNNLISNANKATVKNDLSEAQSAYSIYVGDLIIEELDNVQGTGTIGKTSSNFKTTTSAGVEETRNITLADIGVDSNNVEEISIVGNTIVGIKWKNKYYDVNGSVMTEESYSELGVYKGLTITADTEGVTYTDADGNAKELTEPVEDGDIVIYGDYEYRYNMNYYYERSDMLDYYWENDSSQNGWGVLSISDTYGELCGTILGKPVTHMSATFCNKDIQKSPRIPKTVINIDQAYTFSNIQEEPEIPSSVTSMRGAFNECKLLVNAPEIPSNVIDMTGTFYGCISLISTPEIPSGVTSLSSTFYGCTSLEKVVNIPDKITEMGYAFHGCTSLLEVPNIPSDVTSMYCTFYGCTSLTGDIVINANPTSYAYCFKNTTQPIKLIKAGDATDETLSNLAGTANNGNVTY